jgi:hypothetical protein
MDLSALGALLHARPHGLIALSVHAKDDVRRALWGVLAECESLYWVGPLDDKPVIAGAKAQCWILTCTTDERVASVREVLRRDPHAIHAIGVVDAPLLPLLMHASLSGCIVVAEVDAVDAAASLAALRTFDVDASILDACVVAGLGADGVLQTAGPAPRVAGHAADHKSKL